NRHRRAPCECVHANSLRLVVAARRRSLHLSSPDGDQNVHRRPAPLGSIGSALTAGPRWRRLRDGSNTMSDDFEDHCWKDIVTPDVLEVYSCYRRKVFIGASPALLGIDLYDVVYRGGARA